MIKHIGKPSGELKVKAKDIAILRFPGSRSKKLVEKVLKLSTHILDSVETGNMIFVDIEELEKFMQQAQDKKWRRKHPLEPISHDKLYDAGIRIGGQVREDLDIVNFKRGRVKGYNFYIKNRKPKLCIVASIYSVGSKERILLLRSIFDHPILAHKFLALLKSKYEEMHKKNQDNPLS